MAIIYDPLPELFNVQNTIEGGLANMALLAAGDFIAGENKDWAYYAGAGVGYGAVATGWAGATLAFVAAAEVLEVAFLKSPEGSEFTVFVDGVEYAVISSFLGSTAWDTFTINLLNSTARNITFVNNGADPLSSASFGWMALGAITATGGAETIYNHRSGPSMATNIVSFSIQDDDGDQSSLPIHLPDGLALADYQDYVNQMAPIVKAVCGGVIASATLTLNMTLPVGLSTAMTQYIEVQKGANFSFNTDTRYRYGIRVPAFLPNLFSGDTVDADAPGVPAFTDALITGVIVDGTPVIARDRYGNPLTGVSKITKSFRK